MSDLILDTNVLGEFFEQFFDSSKANRGFGEFVSGRFLSNAAASEINRVVRSFRRRGDITGGIIVISSFGFVELFRKWDQISGGLLDLQKLRGVLEQPPDWLSIAPLDETLIPSFFEVPTHVFLASGFKAVDWTDAVHVATALSRGDGHRIATTDEVIWSLNMQSRVRCL
jgi:predicted nucleic acid-binding protein